VQLDAPGAPLLTYCTNVHPGERWADVLDTLERHVPAVRDAVAAGTPFGVGLRLSAGAAAELDDPRAFAALEEALARHRLFVFTLNGFPYGAFHGTRVKESVYEPDWSDPRRLAYSDRLARLLARLLPADGSREGSVSTVPGAFRPRGAAPAVREAIVEHLLRHAATLHRLRLETGRTIGLGLEPEPGCLLETTQEGVAFLEEQVFTTSARARFGGLAGVSPAEAEPALRRHLGLCLDACHAAVSFETPAECLARARAAGVRLVKIQLTTALAASPLGPAQQSALRAFAEDVYLHQVVERPAGPGAAPRRWLDLPDALAELGAAGEDAEGAGREWRVHFHVPVFQARLGALSNTQPFLAELLAALRAEPASGHLEVETYTWEVLPDAHRGDDVCAAMARELRWVRDRLVR
jgi:sugar phosphate isomerase/epimerase